jgi:hypothetical protein
VKTYLFILLVWFNAVICNANNVHTFSCHVTDISFDELTEIVFHETGVRTYFEESWVNKLKITIHSDSITPLEAISIAVKETNLKASMWQGDIILLPDEELITNLPNYNQDTIRSTSTETSNKIITESEKRYITGKKADAPKTVTVGKRGGANSSNKAKILGRIIEKDTKDAVIGATMYISEIGSGFVSDKSGYYNFVLAPGIYNIKFECLGFEKTLYTFYVLSDGEFNVEIPKAIIPIEEVFVYGDQQSSITSRDAGLERISAKTIREIPMMMGERDILKISLLLPGIVSVGEGSAGLNVRGGSSDQNAFYINKIPVYNTSHLFGFFPSFNSDIIKDFSIYKGHVPTMYGGRLSSVFNIITRQGNMNRFTAHGGVNPVTASLTVETPLKKDTCSILVSARSSYSDWILSRIRDPRIRTSSASFGDFSSAINYNFKKSELSVFVYGSNDFFQLSDINNYQYANRGASIDYHRNFNTSLSGEFALIGSQYQFKTIDEQEASNAFRHNYEINHYEARADFKQLVNDKNSFEYGSSIILYKLNRGSVLPYGLASGRTPLNLGKEQGVESALYFSDNYTPLSWLGFTLGLRYSLFLPIGPKTVYTYTLGLPRDPRYVNDTLNFKSNKPIRTYHSPEVRVSANIKTDQNGSIKIAFNQMSQNLFMLSNTISISPNTQWKLADYNLKPSKSNLYSIGVFRSLSKKSLEASVELYYKSTTNFPEFKDGADFLNNPNIETAVLQGIQKAYGIEFYIKRSMRKLDGWLSYTYSRSFVKIDGPHSWDRINGGEVYPSNYNIPHSLNMVMNYHISRRVIMSSIITYQSGRPITYPISIYYINGTPFVDYSKRNKYKIPDYFRIDYSITLEGNLKKDKFLHSSLMLSVYNLTGRQNPYSVYFKSENGKIKSYKYSVIGIPIVTVTWLFKLGNYSND